MPVSNPLPKRPIAGRDELFRNSLTSSYEHAQRALDEFTDRLEKDPFYAFQWGEKAALAAARLKVINLVERMLPNPLRHVIETAQEQTSTLARFTSFSTSPLDNLMKRYELAAWAEILDTAQAFV